MILFRVNNLFCEALTCDFNRFYFVLLLNVFLLAIYAAVINFKRMGKKCSTPKFQRLIFTKLSHPGIANEYWISQ